MIVCTARRVQQNLACSTRHNCSLPASIHSAFECGVYDSGHVKTAWPSTAPCGMVFIGQVLLQTTSVSEGWLAMRRCSWSCTQTLGLRFHSSSNLCALTSAHHAAVLCRHGFVCYLQLPVAQQHATVSSIFATFQTSKWMSIKGTS